MKSIITSLVALASLSSGAFAQFSSLPPSSATDGINLKAIGLNSGSTHWDNPSTLGGYAATGDTYSDPVTAGSPDSHLGLIWQQNAPSAVSAARAALNARGGSVRVIFVGETAEWLNDFGYTYSGRPNSSQSFTVLQNIQTTGAGANVHFGDYVDIPLTIGEAGNFDLWYNSIGEVGLNTPTLQTGRGGIYTAFNPSNGDPSSTANQFLWANNSIKLNTWMPATGTFMDVDTYMIGIEDWRISAGSDRDYSDFRFALQFFDTNGTPLAVIPEPVHFGMLLGLVAAAGTMLLRRRVTAQSGRLA